jgi:hypothetical protein
MDSMQRLGYDTAPLMGVAGLKDADLADPDVRIPCEALGAIASLAQRTRFTPNLPLELARVTPLGAYPARLRRRHIRHCRIGGATARTLRTIGGQSGRHRRARRQRH